MSASTTLTTFHERLEGPEPTLENKSNCCLFCLNKRVLRKIYSEGYWSPTRKSAMLYALYHNSFSSKCLSGHCPALAAQLMRVLSLRHNITYCVTPHGCYWFKSRPPAHELLDNQGSRPPSSTCHKHLHIGTMEWIANSWLQMKHKPSFFAQYNSNCLKV